MKQTVRLVLPSLLRIAVCALFVFCAPRVEPRVAAAPAPAKHYVCPPCGAPCDGVVYDHPGTCPACGMTLVEQGTVAATPPPAGRRVAILVFDGVEIIDFTGPYEVFGAAGFDVYTVAETKTVVTTAMGMRVVPKYGFADAPQPSVVVVPGGGVQQARRSAATLRWITDVSKGADETMSVCNGAFILASAGLLDGLSATTTFHLIGRLAAEFPKTTVVSDRRFVDNGKIITTAGLSSGIDGALHVVEKLSGKGEAQAAALQIEYDWHPDSSYVRAKLADRLIPDVELDHVGKWRVELAEGTTDRFDIAVRGTSTLSTADLMTKIEGVFTTKGKWRTVSSTGASKEFRFEDERGKSWTGRLTIETVTAEAREYVVRVSIARAG